MTRTGDPLDDPLRVLAGELADTAAVEAVDQLALDDDAAEDDWELQDETFDPEAVRERHPRKGSARNRGEGGQSEAGLVTETLNALNSRTGVRAQKITPGPSGGAGEPDIDGCALTRWGVGRTFKIELKVGNKRPTKVQTARLLQWQESGALVGWATSLDEVDQILALVNNPDYRWTPDMGSGAPTS